MAINTLSDVQNLLAKIQAHLAEAQTLQADVNAALVNIGSATAAVALVMNEVKANAGLPPTPIA